MKLIYMLVNKNKFLTISEVAKLLDLKDPNTNKLSTHTLRFWETKFKLLKPTTLSGGRRYYSKKNIEFIRLIIFLLKEQGLTINGAIKAINNRSKKLDDGKTLSIKDTYDKVKIKLKTKKILNKIKKLKFKN